MKKERREVESERIYTECEALAWVTRRQIQTIQQLLSHPDYTMVNILDRGILYALVQDMERHPLFANKCISAKSG